MPVTYYYEDPEGTTSVLEVACPPTRPCPLTLIRIRFYFAIDLFPEADFGLLMVLALT
jgi:hypothetical protein